ncbi:hypothetical protein JTB14_001242 [Gonioctena quinquepunctata]|nr:hypothetical protein JTB14_001242 [Gonioctena quinquepunctata]
MDKDSSDREDQDMDNIPYEADKSEKPSKIEEIHRKSEEGSEKRGEAGLVPRTYSMGAQPPPLEQLLDEKITIRISANIRLGMDEIKKEFSILNEEMHSMIWQYERDLWMRLLEESRHPTSERGNFFK